MSRTASAVRAAARRAERRARRRRFRAVAAVAMWTSLAELERRVLRAQDGRSFRVRKSRTAAKGYRTLRQRTERGGSGPTARRACCGKRTRAWCGEHATEGRRGWTWRTDPDGSIALRGAQEPCAQPRSRLESDPQLVSSRRPPCGYQATRAACTDSRAGGEACRRSPPSPTLSAAGPKASCQTSDCAIGTQPLKPQPSQN